MYVFSHSTQQNLLLYPDLYKNSFPQCLQVQTFLNFLLGILIPNLTATSLIFLPEHPNSFPNDSYDRFSFRIAFSRYSFYFNHFEFIRVFLLLTYIVTTTVAFILFNLLLYPAELRNQKPHRCGANKKTIAKFCLHPHGLGVDSSRFELLFNASCILFLS